MSNLSQTKQELLEDVEILVGKIAQGGSKSQLRSWNQQKNQYEENISQIEKKITPVIDRVDVESMGLIIDRMIDITIRTYFEYYIFIHDDMTSAILFVDEDQDKIDGLDYPENVKERIRTYSQSKKYREKKNELTREFSHQRKWVESKDTWHPFSLRNCLEARGNVSIEKFKDILLDMQNKPLTTLVDNYDAYRSSAIRQEKEKVQELTKKKAESRV